MDYGVAGKVAVVTGGSSGIGLSIAKLFLSLGARVAICGRNQQRLDEARAYLAADGDRLLAHPCDVLDEAQVKRFCAAVESAFGRADILVNNAGEGRIGGFEELGDADWMDEYHLKLFSVLYPTRTLRALLASSGNGAVVNISSLMAVRPHD